MGISSWWSVGLEHFALMGIWPKAFCLSRLLALVFGSNFFFEIEVNFYNPVNGVTKLVFNDFWVIIFQPSIICQCYI